MSHEAAIAHLQQVRRRLEDRITHLDRTIETAKHELAGAAANRGTVLAEIADIDLTIQTLQGGANAIDRRQHTDSRGPDGPTGPDIVTT